ncbi:MAG: hypothetical protein IKA17_06410 [Clostridia bacterium]|nr:hypothetical protein [Clostridia bacterium]
MKRIILLCVCVIILLTGCKQETENMQSVKILISGGPGKNSCIIEVFSDGSIETTTGDLASGILEGSLNSDEYFNEDCKRKSKNLSKSNRETIDNMITLVKKNCTPVDNDALSICDAIIVYAIVDNVEYCCLYENTYDSYLEANEDLRKLSHKLVDVSPIKLKPF